MTNMNAINISYDQGLRSYMTGVYNWMAIGLAVTFSVAWQMISTGLAIALVHSWLYLVVAFAPLVLVFGIVYVQNNTQWAIGLFFALTACVGASMSVLLIQFTFASIITTFLATAASFAGLSFWGYTTNTNMSKFGTFFIAALFGLLGLMIVNMFIASTGLNFIISIFGVLLFSALIAFDTQNIKNTFIQGNATKSSSIQGALSLYLDFINLFQFLLSFTGKKS